MSSPSEPGGVVIGAIISQQHGLQFDKAASKKITSAWAQRFALRNASVREIDLLFVWHFAIDYECGEGMQGLLETGVGCLTGMLRGTYQLHMPLL